MIDNFKKGQVSIEMLVLIALLVLGGIFFAIFLLGSFNQNIDNMSEVEDNIQDRVKINYITELLDVNESRVGDSSSQGVEIPSNQSYILTLQVNGNGNANSSGYYIQGNDVTIIAIADPNNMFLNWTDEFGNVMSSNESFTFSMPSNNLTYIANFQEISICELTLALFPPLSGTIIGSGSFNCGEEVTIRAIPENNYLFSSWQDVALGTEVSNNSEYTFSLNENKEFVANFLPSFTLKINILGDGNGTVISSSSGIDCITTCQYSFLEGERITLTALYGSESYFKGWKEHGCSGIDSCELIMNSNKEITAEFNLYKELPSLIFIDDNIETIYIYPKDNFNGVNVQWGCRGTLVGANSDSNGVFNTLKIVSNCDEEIFAAKICYDLDEYGYSDWYLPSKTELEKMYQYYLDVNLGDYLFEWVPYIGKWYWSSKESSSIQAYRFNMPNGNFSSPVKNLPSNNFVRCVRSD